MALKKSMSSHKHMAIVNEPCDSKLKLTSATKFLSLLRIIGIFLLVLNEVSTGPAKLTLYRGQKRFQTNTPQCKAGVYLSKPGTYTCACVTGLWGFYDAYCVKPITIAGGDNYCFQLKEFTITQVVPFGNPENPFESSLNVFNKDFHSFKHFYLGNTDTNFDPSSSFLIVTDEAWTLYGNTGSKSICLKPTVEGRRKFCLFSRRPSLKIQSLRKSWNFVKRVSKGCNSTLVWRADSCTDILAPNDFSECTKRSSKDEDEDDESTTESATTSERPRFNFSNGWLVIQPRQPIVPPHDPEKRGQKTAIFYDINDQRTETGWIAIQPRNRSRFTNDTFNEKGWIKIQPRNQNTTVPDEDSTERWIKIPLKEKTSTEHPQNLSMSSEERWIKIPLHKQHTSKPFDNNSLSSEERWIKIPPNSQGSTLSAITSTTTGNPFESSSEERWIKIQPRKELESKPIDDNSLSEERWIKIQPKSQGSTSTTSASTSSTTPDTELKSSSEERWIKIQPKSQGRTSTTSASTSSTTPDTEMKSSSEERWIKIQPKSQGSTSTTFASTSSTTPDTELKSSSEERWIKIQPRKEPETKPVVDKSESEERWIKIQPRKPLETKPVVDISGSEERWIKIQPRKEGSTSTTTTPTSTLTTTPETELNFSSEERWIKIQPRQQPETKPVVDNSVSESEERWIKIQPKSQGSSKSTTSASTSSTTSDTEMNSSSEERWIKIQPKSQGSISSTTTTHPSTSKTTLDTKLKSSSEERWIKIQPRKQPSLNSTIDFSLESPERWIKIQPRKKVTPKPIPEVSSESEERWIKIQPRIKPTPRPKPKPHDNSSSEENWIKIQPRIRKTSTTTKAPLESSSSSSEERWIIIKKGENNGRFKATTPSTRSTVSIREPDEPNCAGTGFSGITRDKVKDYWLDPYSTSCARSINEAVFTDQLRRFTTKQFDRIFPSRLRSLNDVELMLNYTKQIMQKTCPDEFVPNEFFEVALQAVLMFIREDFFYGVEGAHPDAFKRIIHSLKVCLEKAKPFVFEYEEIDCGIRKINGWIILPGKHEQLEVPPSYAYNSFEPLIETTWKMFLNAHSLCFPHFKVSNDHHHFSKLVMEVFSQTIYEKWIEPIEFFDLYEFILPNYHFLHETMENIDYCVAAVSKVSTCPVWMSRTGDQTEVMPNIRKKRNVWMGRDNKTETVEVWDGDGICLQNNTDAESIMSLEHCE